MRGPDYGTYAFQYHSCDTFSTVFLTLSCPVVIPNVLTTNGDGNNDLFIVQNLNSDIYSKSVLTIYNRWGQIVYLDPSYGLDLDMNWWDGTTTYHPKPFAGISPVRDFESNKPKKVRDGVYFYSLELYHRGGSQVKDHHTGYVTIFSN